MSTAAVTLLDKVSFLSWAEDAHGLNASEAKVLRVVLTRLLGLDGDRPDRCWSTNGVLATACRMSRRTVQRAIDGLEAFGLLTCRSIAGRGGRLVLLVPGVIGAAARLRPQKLKDETKERRNVTRTVRTVTETVRKPAADDAGNKGVNDDTFKRPSGEEAPSKRCHPCHLNSVIGPNGITIGTPVDRARSGGTERDIVDEAPQVGERAAPSGSFVVKREPEPAASAQAAGDPANQDTSHRVTGAILEQDGFTLPMRRLLKRLDGIAAKAGWFLEDEFLDYAGRDQLQRWLRMQREGKDALIVREAVEMLSGFFGDSQSDFGEAVARC